MHIYSINGNKMKYIESGEFKLEQDIRDLCETNLNTLFGLIKSVQSHLCKGAG